MVRAVSMAHCHVLLILFPLTVCGVSRKGLHVEAENFMPMFSQKSFALRKSSYYLAEGEDWVPNGITQIAVLMAQQPLSVRVALSGSEAGLKSVSLLYKCSSTESTFSEAPLDTSVLPSSHCSRLRPFTVMIVSAANYQLSLLTENQVPFDQALRHSLELRLRVSFHEGVLESASLFIFNFDALSKIPSYPHFLTERSVQFLDQLQPYFLIRRGTSSFGHIQLLRNELVGAIREASPMLRSLLSFTVYYTSSCSDADQAHLVVANSGYNKVIIEDFSNGFYLNASSGILYATAWSTLKLLELRNQSLSKHETCFKVSLIGDIWTYRRSYKVHLVLQNPVHAKSQNLGENFTFLNVTEHICNHTSNSSFSKLLLPANLQNISLTYPIVCTGEIRYYFQLVGSHCRNSGSNDSAKRPLCSRFYDQSSNSNRINLLGPTSIMHNGNYTVFSSGLSYTYQVTVVSLPIFAPEEINHHDTKVFSLRMGPVTLSCSVMHSDISQVKVTPRFRLQEKFKVGGSWQLVEPREFGAMVLDGDPHGVSVTTIRSATRTEVVVRLSSQKGEDWWQLWKAAFECSASASPEDAQRFGLPEFRARASFNLAHMLNLLSIAQPNSRGHRLYSAPLLHMCAVLLTVMFASHGPRL